MRACTFDYVFFPSTLINFALGLVRKATADTGDSTNVSWKPFSQPGKGDVWLTEVFSRKDFKKLNDSPWVRLYDPR